jgi:hypothetical protein
MRVSGIDLLFTCRVHSIHRAALLASVVISENEWFSSVFWLITFTTLLR